MKPYTTYAVECTRFGTYLEELTSGLRGSGTRRLSLLHHSQPRDDLSSSPTSTPAMGGSSSSSSSSSTPGGGRFVDSFSPLSDDPFLHSASSPLGLCHPLSELYISAETGSLASAKAAIARCQALPHSNKQTVSFPLGFALLLACYRGHAALVQLLAASGAPLDAQQLRGLTGVHLAAQNGHRDVVAVLYVLGADCNQTTRSGKTPLHLAASRNRLNVVQYLVEVARVKADCRTSHGLTPLHQAAARGHFSMVRYFVSRCTSLLYTQDDAGELPISTAARHGRLAVVQYLMFVMVAMPYIYHSSTPEKPSTTTSALGLAKKASVTKDFQFLPLPVILQTSSSASLSGGKGQKKRKGSVANGPVSDSDGESTSSATAATALWKDTFKDLGAMELTRHCIIVAMGAGHISVAQWLHESRNWSPLHHAIFARHADGVHRLIRNGWDPMSTFGCALAPGSPVFMDHHLLHDGDIAKWHEQFEAEQLIRRTLAVLLRGWSPEAHRVFPRAFQSGLRTMLLLNQTQGFVPGLYVPFELMALIFGYLPYRWPAAEEVTAATGARPMNPAEQFCASSSSSPFPTNKDQKNTPAKVLRALFANLRKTLS